MNCFNFKKLRNTLTMKHWCALGTVPNQCWLKAKSSLSKKEKAKNKVQSTIGRNRTKRKQPKGAFQQPRLLFIFRPHHWKCLFFSYESFLHNLYFLKTAICWTRDAHISTGRRATSVQFLLLQCGSSFPESAKSKPTPAGPRAPGLFQLHL